jgi:hypothetical protein
MRHNKKRNVGIIYEQLAQAFSQSLVEKNQKKAFLIKKIIDTHYNQSGEVFKEFKIFNALLKVHASSDSLATSILQEARKATNSLNRKKLQIEKSLLIKDINYTLNEENFYSREILNYKNLATIQSLMNIWQKNSKSDFQKLAEYENKVHYFLREEKTSQNVLEEINPEVDGLVLKIMREKFNKKYKPILSNKQSEIIESYVCENFEKTISLLKQIKEEASLKMKKFENKSDNKVLLEKAEEVNNKILNLDENIIDDENIAKFLLACKLCEQLEEIK